MRAAVTGPEGLEQGAGSGPLGRFLIAERIVDRSRPCVPVQGTAGLVREAPRLGAEAAPPTDGLQSAADGQSW